MIIRAQPDFAVPQVAPVQSQTAQAVQQGLAGVKQAAGQTQAVFREKMQRREVADDATALIDAENRYKLRLQEIERQAREEAPASGDGYLKSVREQRSKARDEILGELPTFISEQGRQSVNNLFSQLDGASDRRATKTQDDMATGWVIDTLDQSVDQDVAAVIENPGEMENALGRALTRLDAVSGRLTPEQEVAARDNIERDISLARVTGLARGGMFTEARDAAKDMKPILSIDQQFQLDASIAQEERAYEAKIDELQRERAEAASIELATSFVQGTLTQQDILAAAPLLGSGSEVRAWSSALDEHRRRQEQRVKDAMEQQRDIMSPITRLALTEAMRAGQGLGDTLQYGVQAILDGQMDANALGSLIQEHENLQDERYKRYSAILQAPFEQGGIFASFDTDTETSRALAMAELSSRWPDMREMSDKEIRTEIEAIAARAGKELVASLPPVPVPSGMARAPRNIDEVRSHMDELAQDYELALSEDERSRIERDMMRAKEWERRLSVTADGE